MTIVNTKRTAPPIPPDARERKVIQVSKTRVLVREPDGDKAKWFQLKANK